MSSLKARIARIEHATKGGGKLVVVKAADETDEEISGLVRTAGVDPEHRDNLVVVLRMETSPAAVLYVVDLK